MINGCFTEEAGANGLGRQPDATLQVFIAYDEIATGKQAMNLMTALARGLSGVLGYNPLPWSFKLLADADWQGVAESDAVKAEMVIIATSWPAGLPPKLKSWFEQIIQKKRNRDAAIICLLDSAENSDCQLADCFAGLQLAANAAGLDFFASATRPSAPLPKDCALQEDFRAARPQ